MPLTVSNQTGDGVYADLIRASIELPDSGSSVSVMGVVQHVGLAVQTITGSPLTAPAPPGSGSLYWVIQVDYTTGAATVKQSTTSMPTADANNLIIFQQTLAPASTDLATVATTMTPDTI